MREFTPCCNRRLVLEETVRSCSSVWPREGIRLAVLEGAGQEKAAHPHMEWGRQMTYVGTCQVWVNANHSGLREAPRGSGGRNAEMILSFRYSSSR